MKRALVAFMAALVVGCASTAAPNFYNGNYYMAGDPSCVYMKPLTGTRIMCVDKNGADSGYRDAMTYEQLQMYQFQMAQQQAQMQALNESMRQAGQSWQNAGQQISQQSQQFTAPQVQPIPTYGVTTYRQVGNSWLGTDGSSCQVVGQSILCSNGKSCQLVGQSLICN